MPILKFAAKHQWGTEKKQSLLLWRQSPTDLSDEAGKRGMTSNMAIVTGGWTTWTILTRPQSAELSLAKKRVRCKRKETEDCLISTQFVLNDAIPTAYLERLFLGTCYARNFANASSPFGRHWDSRSCSCSICQSLTSSRDLGTVGHCKDHQLDIARIRHAENPQEPLSLGLYFGKKTNVELWL